VATSNEILLLGPPPCGVERKGENSQDVARNREGPLICEGVEKRFETASEHLQKNCVPFLLPPRQEKKKRCPATLCGRKRAEHHPRAKKGNGRNKSIFHSQRQKPPAGSGQDRRKRERPPPSQPCQRKRIRRCFRPRRVSKKEGREGWFSRIPMTKKR